MAESIDIRELNIRIEQQSGFVTNLVTIWKCQLYLEKCHGDTMLKYSPKAIPLKRLSST